MVHVILLDQVGAVSRPREVLWVVDPQEFEAGHTLHCYTIDVDG